MSVYVLALSCYNKKKNIYTKFLQMQVSCMGSQQS